MKRPYEFLPPEGSEPANKRLSLMTPWQRDFILLANGFKERGTVSAITKNIGRLR